MPENKTIHDLPIAEQVTSSDVFETEIPSQLMQSGFASRKVSLSELEEHILGDEQYSTGLPNFPAGSRTIFGALEYARQSGGGGGASVVQKTMAEYTALPSSEKTNGSIYKITDKALIYCLDEAYHAVKEITSADYALLTSDEKNNGTLYIITDEETTAADIPYSSGVSVADKLVSIDSKLHIEAGQKQASSTQAVRVTFANAYTTPPHVVIVPYNSTSPREYIRSCTVTAITTTYFEFVEQAINKQLNSFLNGTDACEWIAYGV